MNTFGKDDLERTSAARLSAEDRVTLLEEQTECTVVFAGAGAGGWPTGVVMSFMEVAGAFWLTSTDDRPQVRALASDPRMSIVVSNAGTTSWGRQMISYRGVGTVHRDRATLEWFYPLWAQRLAPASAEEFIRLLDSPKRVLVRFDPVAVQASHDSRRMPGDGRGGPRPSS
ncbi:MAG: hypothetical protein CMH83_21235 [Nocardioides sp.]|nr:hypothetical protein [Nocardioides sp.]